MQATSAGGVATVTCREAGKVLWEFRMPGQALRLLSTPHYVAVALKSGILQVRNGGAMRVWTIYSCRCTPCHSLRSLLVTYGRVALRTYHVVQALAAAELRFPKLHLLQGYEHVLAHHTIMVSSSMWL